jgi:hypothetical protein
MKTKTKTEERVHPVSSPGVMRSMSLVSEAALSLAKMHAIVS